MFTFYTYSYIISNAFIHLKWELGYCYYITSNLYTNILTHCTIDTISRFVIDAPSYKASVVLHSTFYLNLKHRDLSLTFFCKGFYYFLYIFCVFIIIIIFGIFFQNRFLSFNSVIFLCFPFYSFVLFFCFSFYFYIKIIETSSVDFS